MSRKSKILLVSSAFYPEISPRSYRATELAKEFCRLGYEVVIISKFRDYDYSEFTIKYPVTYKMWPKPILPKIPNCKTKPFSFIARAVTRLSALLFEYPGIEDMFNVKQILKKENNYDLMISFAVPFPVHWGVAWARSEEHNIAETWIADCGDPYMYARLDTFRKPFYFKIFEKYFCRKCDYLTVPFDEMKNQFYPEFRSKIKVIPQGFNQSEIVLFESKPEYNKPVFIFAGSIIPKKRDLTLFLDFISSLPRDFLFIIYTNQQEWYKRYKELLGEKLVINEYIDRLSLIYEMSKADFLVNVDTIHDNQTNIEAIPSKLIDYALANRPILNINSSWLDKEMVTEFLNKDYSRRRVIEKSRYDITKIVEKFLIMVNSKSE